MNIALYSRNLHVRDVAFIQKLLYTLRDRHIDVQIHDRYYKELKQMVEVPSSFVTFHSHEEIKDTATYFMSLGGDGTLLDAVTYVRHYNIPVLGVNLGRLGFLANVGKQEINEALDCLHNGTFIIDKRTMISLESTPALFGELNYALNEFTIVKKDTSSMLNIHAYLNGEFLNSYWADGLIVSTATGSTGYSLSCGGPIIAPSSSDFVITPISPHNLNVRPFIVPDTSVISFEVEGRNLNYLCTLDSRSETIDSSYLLAVKKCDHMLSLLRLPDHSFLRTLSTKLNWGSDSRRRY
jgi:NAD+ kinase